jgi:hypothetical protein
MLPSPTRADAGLGSSADVARTNEYAVEKVQLEFVNDISQKQAIVVPDVIELKNANTTTSFSIQQRLAIVMAIWERADNLPNDLRVLVLRHKNYVTAEIPIPKQCEKLVSQIQQEAAKAWPGTDRADDPITSISAHLKLNMPVEPPPMDTASFAFEGGFSLETARGVPERVRRSIIQRRGQQSFRKALLSAYGSRCQVTKYTGEPALEAAHIWPYAEGGEYTNDLRNGLLLRADIHVLFDLGLLKVHPTSLRVKVMEPLAETSYAAFEGTVILTNPPLRPSDEALTKKWTMAS